MKQIISFEFEDGDVLESVSWDTVVTYVRQNGQWYSLKRAALVSINDKFAKKLVLDGVLSVVPLKN